MGRKVLGLEINSGEIKLALVKNGGHPSVLYCETIPAPKLTGAALSDDDTEIMSTALAVKEVVSREAKTMRGVDSVALCLSDQQTVVRYMSLPALGKKELLAAVEYELSQSFPGVGKTHSISFKEYSRTNKQVTGIASFSPKKSLEAYRKLIEQLDFKYSYIDVLANSQAKAVHMVLNTPRSETVLVCDISPASSHYIVIMGRQVMHSRQVPEGHRQVKELATATLGRDSIYDSITSPDADESYIQKDELMEIISAAYSGVEEQLRQTIEFYNMDNRDTPPVSRVLLTGSGSFFPGLEGYLSSNIGIPVSVVNPGAKTKAADAKTFAVCLSAIGAAIRED
jgi:type IV pilus assembly protein PilM